MDKADDKETMHCEFDISSSGLTWISGKKKLLMCWTSLINFSTQYF